MPELCVVPVTAPTTEAPRPTTTTVAATTTTVAAVTTTVQVDATTVVSTPVTPPVPVTPAPQVEAVDVSNTLPVTGTASLPVFVGGAGLLLLGVGLVVVARRRGAAV